MTTDAKFIDDVFTAALGVPAAERETLIRERCGSDAAAVRRVLRLLESASQPIGSIEDRFDEIRNQLWSEMVTSTPEHEEDLTGKTIGAWSVQRRIARGGLATVYRAERSDDNYQQLAAFKVLRRGLDTDDLVTRFRAERQILSSLEHPGIAKLLDGGSLEDGRPYLVLEYVDGLPIDEYCGQHRVPNRQKITLMIDVARAIHHAHQHQVVHRDIKPSNILVTAEGDVRLLDFGIAKLLDPTLMPAATPMTRTGVSLLTPAYASPEQLAGEVVTTASDIYQLGKVAGEIFGENPARDLAAVVAKAAHPDRNRRYASAEEFVADLERYLDGFPVLAQPDTLGYRLKMLSKRNPLLLPAVTIGVLGVAVYLVTLQRYSDRLEREQELSAATQSFLVGLFESPDPFAQADGGLGREITVVDALDLGQRRIRMELAEQPELRAALMGTISDVYRNLDVSDSSIDMREEALTIEKELYGAESPQVLASLRSLGGLYTANGDVDKGSRLIEEQLRLARKIYADDPAQLALSEIAAGIHANFKGDIEQSRVLLHSGIDKLRNAPDDYARHRIDALIVLAQSYGIDDEATTRAAIDEAINVASRVYGEGSLQTASARIRLASTLTLFADYEASERNFLQAIPVLKSQLGENHSITLNAMNNLGYLYHRRGDEPAAEAMHREVLQGQIAVNGELHRNTGDSYQNLASAITQQGRYDESIPLHRRAHQIYSEVLNDNHYLAAIPLLSISFANLQRGDGAAAEAASRQALERFRLAVPGTFLEGVAQCLVGLSLEKQGRISEGNAHVTGSHALIEKGNAPAPYPAICRVPAE